jgi:hypothetical protein
MDIADVRAFGHRFQAGRIPVGQHWMRSLLLLMACMTMVACSSAQQKPPDCAGEYQRVNAPDKYPVAPSGEPLSGSREGHHR